MQAASESAYLSDDPLTRQKVWAAGAMGGLLGGGLGGGLSLAGSAAGAARSRLSNLLGPSGKAPPSSLAEKLGDATVTRDAAQEVADRVMAQEGVPAAPGLGTKLHQLLTDNARRQELSRQGRAAVLTRRNADSMAAGVETYLQQMAAG